jgi:hypothetical protein
MIVGLCVLALAGEALTVPPCESARLVKVRAVERAERRAGGPVPPTDDGATPAPGVSSSTLYDLTLACGGKTYVARVAGGQSGFRPDELDAAVSLHLRAERGKLFLKREGGTEFEARLTVAPQPKNPPPR